ncbi:MAG: ACT domain-containing protein, partial [Acidobacteria bacterium]|nr:ACT domain-containing protein [Acidobacteriota bacterium]
KFAMVLVADSRRSTTGVAELKDRFREAGQRLGVNIYAQREDLFIAMHRV